MLGEPLFALILTYSPAPEAKDFIRVFLETEAACVGAISELIQAEEEHPVIEADTIKLAICVDRRNLKPSWTYQVSVEKP